MRHSSVRGFSAFSLIALVAVAAIGASFLLSGKAPNLLSAVSTSGSSSLSASAHSLCGLYRGGTDAAHMIASPNPASSIADTDTACAAYCDASGPKPGDVCLRTVTVKTYAAVGLPDLVASAVAPNTQKDVVVGVPVVLSATIKNQGGAAASSSTSQFQTAASAAGAGAVVIGYGKTGALAAGGAGETTLSYAFPLATSPTRYVRACADLGQNGGTVKESNEGNNCGPWTAINVSSAAASIQVGDNSTSATLTYNANTITNSYGTFTIKFDITAVEGDAYIPKSIQVGGLPGSVSPTPSAGVVVKAAVDSTNTQTSPTVTASLTTTADASGTGFYVVHDGDTETFTATITIGPNGVASSTSTYHVGLDKVRFKTTPTDAPFPTNVEIDETNPAFRTDPIAIPG